MQAVASAFELTGIRSFLTFSVVGKTCDENDGSPR